MIIIVVFLCVDRVPFDVGKVLVLLEPVELFST